MAVHGGLGAVRWLQMLCKELHLSFVLGVALVYGLAEGFGVSLLRVVSDYYWKDVQRIQPSVLQFYVGLCYIPALMKPAWGVLTDSFPISGYHRRPYFVLAGVLGIFPILILLAPGQLTEAFAVACFISINAGIAISGVTIDACITKSSNEHPTLTRDMQTLCMFCTSVGALLGYSSSGLVLHHLGTQGALVLLLIPSTLMLILGFMMYEPRIHRPQLMGRPVLERVTEAMQGMTRTMRAPQVWKPSLYVYFSLTLSISTHEGLFYWYNDPKVGPAFSQEFVGMIYAIGAMGSIGGILIYHNFLEDWTFRNLLFFAQMLFGFSGMLDLVLVLRWNVWFGIPDYAFVAIEESCSRIVFKLSLITINVLCTKLCPLGIEGTFSALLKCIQSMGSFSSTWGGSIALHAFDVTRSDLSNLSSVLLVRNFLRFATLGLIFLVPNTRQADLLLPPPVAEAEVLPLNERIED